MVVMEDNWWQPLDHRSCWFRPITAFDSILPSISDQMACCRCNRSGTCVNCVKTKPGLIVSRIMLDRAVTQPHVDCLTFQSNLPISRLGRTVPSYRGIPRAVSWTESRHEQPFTWDAWPWDNPALPSFNLMEPLSFYWGEVVSTTSSLCIDKDNQQIVPSL